MAFRSFILIALASSVFIVACADHITEASSSAVAQSSSDGSSVTSFASAQSTVRSTQKQCRRVMKCKNNEEFSYCTQSIGRAQYCSQRGQTLANRGDNTSCKEGCVCKEDFLRSSNGICIPERKCEAKCGPNEVLDDCPVDCASDYCPTSDEDSAKCVRPDEYDCPPPVCKCRFNYRRATNGSCIPTRDCPPYDCCDRPNEKYNACPPICPTDDCSQASPSGKCPLIGRIGIILECNPKCRCIEGYWRKDGICVPYRECPNVCPPDEEFVPCIQGVCRAMNCSQRGEDVPCPDRRWPEEQCDAGCICKENYLRTDEGTCVPEDQCPLVCSDNEVLDNCPSDCPADYCPTCEADNEKCPKPDPCPPPACKCSFNFRRDENDRCISTEECPPFDCSDKPNEQYTPCPPLCPTDECGLPRLNNRCPFRIGIRLECNPKCQCKDGYGRSNGTCVPFEECPNLCPEYEEYSSCTQAVCRPQTCSDREGPFVCPMIAKGSCIRGCVCKENYYRNENGTCVTADNCGAPLCPRPNEKYSISRIPNCPRLGTCNSIVARIPCDKPEVPGCICVDGYLRYNETTGCIPTCECPEIARTPECLNRTTTLAT